MVKNEQACAILAWIFPIGLIWYFIDENLQKSSLANFHVKQSLVLFIAAVIGTAIGTIIPLIGWFIILPLVSLASIVLWILGLINALGEKEKELPVIGQYASYFEF